MISITWVSLYGVGKIIYSNSFNIFSSFLTKKKTLKLQDFGESTPS